MRRRDFLTLAGAVAWPLAARAQPAEMPVIGYLSENTLSANLHAAFLRGMAALGYVEGKNLLIEDRHKPQSLPEAAADLVRRKVNVIFASNPGALSAAIKATTSIPVVGMDLESDPVAKGYVQSIARPGGNITGVFLDIPELCGKQLGLLKEIVPGLSRIAIFGIPGHNAPQFAATEAAAGAVGVKAEVLEVKVADDLEGALEEARVRPVEAGILLPSPFTFQYSKLIAEFARAKRLPLISLFAEFSRNGGLMGYGPNLDDLYRRCGEYVGKVLHGAKPSELPLQRPETFDLIINVKTATAIGVELPARLQLLANELVE
ncbi:putative ABC transport system substrate-binding protein [Bradyrhizobium sp. USDA 4448]